MLLFRSLTLGLLGACFMMLATRPRSEVRVVNEEPRPVALMAQAAMIVDVAPGISAAQLGTLVRLVPGEHVVAVDDRQVSGDLDAGSRIAMRDLHGRSYVDLTVSGAAGLRRVLVLLH